MSVWQIAFGSRAALCRYRPPRPSVRRRRSKMTARAHLRSTGPLALVVLMATALGTSIARPAAASGYVQDKLVSYIPGAVRTDPNLVNPWGLASGPNTPLWVANAGT